MPAASSPRTGSASSVLMTVLGLHVPVGGSVPLAGLVAALGALGVGEKAARQAVWRATQDGLLQIERAGGLPAGRA